MKAGTVNGSNMKVAFVVDDRLPHDRKAIFSRSLQMMKSKFSLTLFSSNMTEEALLLELEKQQYGLVLLPWYHYVQWKKIEAFYGTLRMQGATVAGYFADAVLPFEFSSHPNYHRFILLDFYHFDQLEIEWILQSLLAAHRRSGLNGLFARTTTVYYDEWSDDGSSPTKSIDAFLKHPLMQGPTWNSRLTSIRFFMTALWSICFENKHLAPTAREAATLEIAELNKRMVIKLLFESTDLTLHSTMNHLWPNSETHHTAFQELTRHSDFLRVHHFPESQQIEITAFFTPAAPAIQHASELRGWWIEPLASKHVKTSEIEVFVKRIPLSSTETTDTSILMTSAIDSLRALLSSLSELSPTESAIYETRLVNLKFLIQEIDKKMLEKKAA